FLLSPSVADGLDLEKLEANLRKTVLRIAARFLENALNKDLSDYEGGKVACNFCGKDAHYVDRRSKTFTTTLGDITLERAYYHCPACGNGWCPRDQSLGFGDSS